MEYRIERIQEVTLNGRRAKLFSAFERMGNAFVHVGRFSAPIKTPNRDLWKFINI